MSLPGTFTVLDLLVIPRRDDDGMFFLIFFFPFLLSGSKLVCHRKEWIITILIVNTVC